MESSVDYKLQYSRFKGADWFENIYKKDILVIGTGGIGSWLNVLLSRTGCNLHIFDYDLVEEHNISGQLFKMTDSGTEKTEAIKNIIKEFSGECEVELYTKYEESSITNDIVLSAVDNMAARKLAFTKWKANLSEVEDKSKCIFIDGRLLAEQLQIFSIRGDDDVSIERYKNEFLFSDAEVDEEDCTYKQTSHCAAMIASHMTAFLTNFLGENYRRIPFFYSYIIQLNNTETYD